MMTQQEYEQRIAAAKKVCAERVSSARREYEVALSDIRRRRQECNIESKYIDDLRNKYVKSAYDEYRHTREAIEVEYQDALAAQRKSGHLSYKDFLGAVRIVHRFLKQADNDGIIIPWGESGSVEIRFKAEAMVETEGGDA